MRSLQQMLPDVLEKREILKAARAQLILRRWPEFVGQAMAERSLPDQYDKGTVWVAVTSSSWAQEMRMMTDTILERLNAAAGEKLFTAIRYGVRARKGLPGTPPIEVKECDLSYEGMTFREIAERRYRLIQEDASRSQ